MIQNILKNYGAWLITHALAAIGFLTLCYYPSEAKTILVYSGYTAVFFLVLVLALNPLKSRFQKSILLKYLNKYRREIGVASFSYTILHIISYMVKKGSLTKFLKYVFHPAIIPVLFIALPILFVLTISSNNYSMKKLGFNKWKKLHQRVYIADIAIFLHMILIGEVFYSFLIFIPLFIIQYVRI